MTEPRPSGTSATEAAGIGPTAPSDRILVLDILRGFAILGMFIVHFVELNPARPGAGVLAITVQQAIAGFIINKSRWTFSFLFGVSFAIQLRRAEARGADGRLPFLRRLLGIAGFGVLTGILVGAVDLIDYAWAGLWLLLLRRWSTRALVVALAAGVLMLGVWDVAVGGYQWATMGAARANAEYLSPRPVSAARRAAHVEAEAAAQGSSFLRLARARLVAAVVRGAPTDLFGDWRRGSTGTILVTLSRALSIFLLGFLAVRLGVFERPHEHRRLLWAALLAGVVSWGVAHASPWPAAGSIPSMRVAEALRSGLGLLQDGYLFLTYVAAITLLVASSKAWERRLTVLLGVAGRMALTNYILQFAVIGLLFDRWALGIRWLSPAYAPVAGTVLFAALAVFSRWWLGRFRFGPAEWVLRSLTYARLQPLRRAPARAA